MESEQYSYVLTEAAEADVEDAFDDITNELYNAEAASAFADELEKTIEEICKTPKSGRLLNNPYLKRDDIRRVLIKNYIAYYLIDADAGGIVILRVVYNRRNQDTVLKSI